VQLISIRRSYDRFAERYDEIFRPRQTPKIMGLATALPTPLPGPVVDLGAGTGLVGVLLADRLPHGLIALDASRGMLSRSEGRRVQGDLNRLPFGSDRFGLVISVTALIDFVDPSPAIAEMARILRPGGWLALSVLKIDDVAGVQDALNAHAFEVVERLDLQQDIGFVCRWPTS